MTEEDPFEAIMRSKREDADKQLKWQKEMFDLEHKGQQDLSDERMGNLDEMRLRQRGGKKK